MFFGAGCCFRGTHALSRHNNLRCKWDCCIPSVEETSLIIWTMLTYAGQSVVQARNFSIAEPPRECCMDVIYEWCTVKRHEAEMQLGPNRQHGMQCRQQCINLATRCLTHLPALQFLAAVLFCARVTCDLLRLLYHISQLFILTRSLLALWGK